MSKTKILNVRIDPNLKKAAKKLAESDGRTLSNWVTRLIRREVERASAKKNSDLPKGHR
jgi:predicted HicB family RNase H-like nuclease